uniref:Uncharacterized protein n=1 Tax=Anguilla anguilla TaxID=7936 RepID=A0A0E9XYX1_ANGAN
MVCLSSVSVL